MSDALFAQGTKLYASIGGAWVKFPELRRLTPPERQSTFIDVTHLESANNDDEVIKGMNRKGNCTGEIAYIPQNALVLQLHADRDATGTAAKRGYLIEFPDAAQTVQYFEAYPESVGPAAASVGGDLALPFSLKPTGPIFDGTGGSTAIDEDPTTWS